MDRVGPDVVPTVETIRHRFEARRRDAGPLAKVFRRLIGLELKLKQYAEGAVFVRTVIDAVGMAGLNVVWASADRLPSGEEIRDPRRWLDRMSADPAVPA
jgi:putative hydrolase